MPAGTNIPPVAFRCDATTVIALGHLKRCLSLADAFREMGRAAAFLCFDDPAARDVLDGLPYQTVWMADQINQGNDNEAMMRALESLGCDTVIVDSYNVDAGYFDRLRQAGQRIIYFEDEEKTDWDVDVIINGVLGTERLRYTAPQVLLGPDYLVLGREYWNGENTPQPETGPLEIMITMGGIDHYDLTSRVIALLDRLPGPIRINAVIGPYYENTANIDAAAARCRHEVVIHNQPQGLADLIRRCHAAVSAGGFTLYELARFGVPAIGVWLWENQRRNVEQLGTAGVVLPLGYAEGPEFDETLGQAIQSLLENEDQRREMSRLGPALVDGRGALRVAEAVLKESVAV